MERGGIADAVLQGLPASRVKKAPAYLFLADNLKTPIYTFLYNPEKWQRQMEARYESPGVLGSTVQSHFWSYTEGQKLSLDNVLIETYAQGKNANILIERLESYLKPLTGKVSPPLLILQMGGVRFGPCVLLSLATEETAWLERGVARARVSMKLQRTKAQPKPKKITVTSITPEGSAYVPPGQKAADAVKYTGKLYDSRGNGLPADIVQAPGTAKGYQYKLKDAKTTQFEYIYGKDKDGDLRKLTDIENNNKKDLDGLENVL
jgi:hypothetical protein